MRRVPHVMGVDERAQAHGRGESTDARDVRLDDVERPARQEALEAEDAELRLAAGERDRLRAPDELVTVDVVGIDRLFQEGGVVPLESTAGADRRGGVVR